MTIYVMTNQNSVYNFHEIFIFKVNLVKMEHVTEPLLATGAWKLWYLAPIILVKFCLTDLNIFEPVLALTVPKS